MNILAINWSNVGLQLAQLLLALSILIILHEFGHYITARWFKCRVEKFFLFFDPWFALVKKKIGDTVYGIGWLPLGGYVKISGMIDESMDKEALKQPPKEWEFRSKPAWQRLIVMLGGIIMNVLVAFVIYAFVLMIWGEKNTPNASVKDGIWVTDSLMNKLGFQNGDKVMAVNDKPIEYFEDIQLKVLVGGRKVLIERNGKDTLLDLPINLIGKLVSRKDKRRQLIAPRIPAYVGKYSDKDTFYGKKAGLQEMDRITAIDSVPIRFYDEMAAVLKDHKNGEVTLTVERNNQEIKLVSKVNEEGKIGIPYLDDQQYDSLGVYHVIVKKYGFAAAFPAGIQKAGKKLSDYIDQFKMILNPKTEGYKALGGFKAIGSVFPTSWSWEAFWNITAFLSIILAFMNLLPIPALDGGHVMFTLYEIVTGRKPNEKFLEYAQLIGMALLIALMLYANGNDWFGWGK
jgi:regulator of sigma E protease